MLWVELAIPVLGQRRGRGALLAEGQRGNPIDKSSLLERRTKIVSSHYVQGNKYFIFSINKFRGL